jgi:hypothetical protein
MRHEIFLLSTMMGGRARTVNGPVAILHGRTKRTGMFARGKVR